MHTDDMGPVIFKEEEAKMYTSSPHFINMMPTK